MGDANRGVARTFLSAGSGDFPVARSSGRVACTLRNTGLESPVNPRTGMSALRGSWVAVGKQQLRFEKSPTQPQAGGLRHSGARVTLRPRERPEETAIAEAREIFSRRDCAPAGFLGRCRDFSGRNFLIHQTTADAAGSGSHPDQCPCCLRQIPKLQILSRRSLRELGEIPSRARRAPDESSVGPGCI